MILLKAEDFKGMPTIPSDDWLEEGKDDFPTKSLYQLRIKFRNRTEFMRHVNSIPKDGTRFRDGNRTLHLVPYKTLRSASNRLNKIAKMNS